VISPHFGPLPFGPEQNQHGTTDFAVGEEVAVQVEGPKNAMRITSVSRARHRADQEPPGTRCEALAGVNAGRHNDIHWQTEFDLSTPPATLEFWVGDCCSYCGPGWTLRFEGVVAIHGLNDDTDFEELWFRFATDEEIRDRQLEVPNGARAYRLISTHRRAGPPPDDVFVVARSADCRPEKPRT